MKKLLALILALNTSSAFAWARRGYTHYTPTQAITILFLLFFCAAVFCFYMSWKAECKADRILGIIVGIDLLLPLFMFHEWGGYGFFGAFMMVFVFCWIGMKFEKPKS
ncbi:TPA: hypothetical protein ACODIZ_003695 [Salmonella enterica subsp. enterica serovar Newport]